MREFIVGQLFFSGFYVRQNAEERSLYSFFSRQRSSRTDVWNVIIVWSELSLVLDKLQASGGLVESALK